MKVLIVSGFLGAGKTSFIKKLVKKSDKQVVILENEFGDKNLDGKYLETTLENTNEDIKIWELTQGCICCSINLDLTYSILTIHNTLNPDYLIIEPSGVAKLSKVLDRLKKIEYGNIEIGMPITIIDAYNLSKNLRENKEYILDFIRHSGLVVLSKSEDFSTSDFYDIKENLNLSENIEFPLLHYSKWTEDKWKKIFNTKSIVSSENNKVLLSFVKESPNIEKFEQITFSSYNIHNADELSFICMYLMSGRLGDIERVKGNLALDNYSLKFDLVGEKYEVTGSNDLETNEVVIIGKNLNKEGLKTIFKAIK